MHILSPFVIYTICLNELLAEADDVVKIIKCGHLFHRKCLTEWASKHKSCPMSNVQGQSKLFII